MQNKKCASNESMVKIIRIVQLQIEISRIAQLQIEIEITRIPKMHMRLQKGKIINLYKFG